MIFTSAAFTIGAQRAFSASITARNSADELPTGSMNCVASFSFTAGDLIAYTISLLILSIIAAGVPPGAISPIQVSASTSTPDSFSVGILGR